MGVDSALNLRIMGRSAVVGSILPFLSPASSSHSAPCFPRFLTPPVGVLFSVEVMCSHFALRHYFPCFFSAACGALTFRLFSVWSGDIGDVQHSPPHGQQGGSFPSELPNQQHDFRADYCFKFHIKSVCFTRFLIIILAFFFFLNQV